MHDPFDPYRHQADVAAKTLVVLDRIAEVLRTQLWDRAKQRGLTPLQVRVLQFVANHPDLEVTVTALAREFQLTKATVSETVRLLTNKKLVEKVRGGTDARSFYLRLTNSGKAELAHVVDFSESLRRVLAGIPTTEQRQLYGTLLTALYGFQRADLVPLQRMCFNCRHLDRRGDVHYCTLLETELPIPDLRVDCPEFSPADE